MNPFVRGTLPLVLLCCLTGCKTAATRPPEAHATGNVTHVVVCWLKEPGNAGAREQLVRASETFTKIPGVVSVKAGAPLPSSRPVVDTSYDLAVIITFDSRDSLRRYDSHPLHRDAVHNVLTPLVSKFIIYDFENSIRP